MIKASFHWERLAARAQMHVGNTMGVLDSMYDAFPNRVKRVRAKALDANMNDEFINRLSDNLIKWHEEIAKLWLTKW